MHNFLSFIKEFKLPKKQELEDALSSLSNKQFWLFVASLIVAIFSMLYILEKINLHFTIDRPLDGGTVTEGIIGMPTLVNPVLSLSDADKDLTALVYSGLMRKSANGGFIPDLAESYKISPDGLVYTFILKKNIKFQDGFPITADDVLFTINKIQDPLIKSPKKSVWGGVSVEKIDDRTLTFTISKPYISFMNNTTIGIMPEHLWKNVSAAEFGLSTLNIKAVGSGPYKIDSTTKNNDGIPVVYNLSRWNGFVLGKPHIQYFKIVSYPNEKSLLEAISSHSINLAFGISPENAKFIKDNSYNIYTSTPPRIFGIFFNSSKNKILADSNVINAINLAINKQAIVDDVLNGYGTVINSPVPSTIMKPDDTTQTIDLDKAAKILDNDGWVLGKDGIRNKGGSSTIKIVTKKVGKKTITQKITVPSKVPGVRLAFSLTTGDTPELKETSTIIRDQLAKIGIEVNIEKVYETGPLNQQIRNRDYEALLFGQVVNNESDLYAFWHSSQRVDPGLNIAMYSNKKVDTILESVQKILSVEDRISKYVSFVKEFNNDIPAILIYSPKYLYVSSRDLDHISVGSIYTPSDRFLSVYNWYASKEHVWKIFTK